MLMGVSGIVWGSFGVFLVALEGEFGWSRSAISAAFGLFALTNAFTAPFLGYAMGRWDSRLLLAGLSILLATGLAMTALIAQVEAFWLTFGIIGGLGAHCFSSYAIFAVLAGQFRARPATAMSIADAGSGLAVFLGLPVLQLIVGSLGWRTAYVMLAVLVAVAGVTLHVLALAPVRRISNGSGHRNFVPGLPFLAMALSFFCGSAAYHGLLTQQIALLDESGLSIENAVWIAAVGGLVVFLWRLLSGWLADIFGVGSAMGIALVGSVVTFVSLVGATVEARDLFLFVYPLALGVAFGGQQVLLAVGMRTITSRSHYPVALGFGRLASGIGMASGPIAAGLVYDVSGQYALTIGLLAAMTVLHFVTFGMAARFRLR